MKYDEDAVIETLREMARAGASMLALVNFVHDVRGTPRYNRGLMIGYFYRAFGLTPLDFTRIVFACEIFGDGASMKIQESERLFRARLVELRSLERT